MATMLHANPSFGASSAVPANLTKAVSNAAPLRPSYMLTRTETEALAISNRGKTSLIGGYKTTSGIDLKHHIVLVERVCCARNEFFLFRGTKPVLPDTADADLQGLGIKGIAVGATDVAVLRRFGQHGLKTNDGTGIAQYVVHWNDHCRMRYTFDIKDHVVRGMSARDAC